MNDPSPPPLPDGLVRRTGSTLGCWWAGDDPLYVDYHDAEWGRPVVDDSRLFEKLCLEGFQAGLSWITVLRKREAFRRAFDGFDPATVAGYGETKVTALLDDAAIIRHRGKIEATINNAGRCLELQEQHGSLAGYVWGFEPAPADRPAVVTHVALMELTQTDASRALSRDLKQRGWRFVGPTTVYAFMQAMGLVNDHVEGCGQRAEVEAQRSALLRP
jgi:DNA-3-methyladenine glycosylase I